MFNGLFLFLGVILPGCSATAQRGEQPIDFGVLKESTKLEQHVFSNSQLGMSFRLPDCFAPFPEAQTQQAADSATHGRPYILLNALCKQPDGSRAAVTLIVEPIPDGVTPEKYAKVCIANVFPKPNATLEKDVHPEMLAGRTFQSYEVTITGAEVKLKQRYYTTTHSNAGITLIMMASSDSMMSTLFDSVQNSYRGPS